MNRAHIYKQMFFVLAIFIVLVEGRRSRVRMKERQNYNRRHNSRSSEFDVLIFTQHWPQTVCFTWKEEEKDHQCLLPQDRGEWSIHGIWPTKYKVIGPSYCNRSLPFDYKAIKQLEDELNTKWLDVEVGRSKHSFWTHEWEKHGTCAMVLEPLNNEYKYFKKGIDFFDTYDMKNVLGKSLIVPGRGYKVQQILDGVHKELGKKAQVECVVNPKTKESYLFEIRICFDKKLNLVDCDGIPGFPTNCSRKKDVIYPGDVPSEYSAIIM